MRMFACLSLVCLFIAGCGGRQGQSPIPSPSGTLTLHTHIEQRRDDPTAYGCVVFEIRDSTGRLLHTENTRASDFMRWNMTWLADDHILLKSSDIGARHWRRQPDGSWAKEVAGSPPGDGIL